MAIPPSYRVHRRESDLSSRVSARGVSPDIVGTVASELFREIAHPTARIGTRKGYTVSLSILVHGVAVAGVVIAPLMAVDLLQPPGSIMAFVAPAPLPSARPPAPPRPTPTSPSSEAPSEIVRPKPSFDPSRVYGVEAGIASGLAGGFVGGALGAPPPPPPPVAPVRVGGFISFPTKVFDVAPVYPPEAEAAGVQGLVILQAIIDTSGQVTDVEVLRSVPLLDDAAIRAVQRWWYSPTLVNGVPVSVIVTITVNFILSVRLLAGDRQRLCPLGARHPSAVSAANKSPCAAESRSCSAVHRPSES